MCYHHAPTLCSVKDLLVGQYRLSTASILFRYLVQREELVGVEPWGDHTPAAGGALGGQQGSPRSTKRYSAVSILFWQSGPSV